MAGALACGVTYSLYRARVNPYGEHDFGSVDLNGGRYFWKIDYYDNDLTAHSPDPADPDVTRRVLTIMCAGEY